jgi:hypothetical protein
MTRLLNGNATIPDIAPLTTCTVGFVQMLTIFVDLEGLLAPLEFLDFEFGAFTVFSADRHRLPISSRARRPASI